jgi:tetratricopeptide (TPR) repeat protein
VRIRRSSISFETAVKHLFRHLHDPRALRENPLAQQFLSQNAPGDGIHRPADALKNLHRAIRQAANQCRDDDFVAGIDERGQRQFSILVLHCLERRDIKEVACLLGISWKHCYRERAAICLRVGALLRDGFDAADTYPLLLSEEFDCLLERALLRAELVDGEKRFEELLGLVSLATTSEQAIEVLYRLQEVALDSGELARANAARIQAVRLFDKTLSSQRTFAAELSKAYLDLMQTNLAFHRGDKHCWVDAATRSVQRLEPLLSDSPRRVTRLYIESLYKLSMGLAALGKLEQAYRHLHEADMFTRREPAIPMTLRLDVTTALCRLSNHLVMHSTSWCPSARRVGNLREALEHARMTGPLLPMLNALQGLTEYYSSVHRDEDSLRAAQFAILLANQQPSERWLIHTVSELAIPLQRTQYWQLPLSILSPLRDKLALCDAMHRYELAYLTAEQALREGAYPDAWELSYEACSSNNIGTVMGRVKMRLIAAAAAEKLGQKSQSQELLEHSISEAEALGSAILLEHTYSVAADLGQRTFKDRLIEIGHVLRD